VRSQGRTKATSPFENIRAEKGDSLAILILLKNPKNASTGSYFDRLSRTEKSPNISTALPFVPSGQALRLSEG
jgi:hypothetical protein